MSQAVSPPPPAVQQPPHAQSSGQTPQQAPAPAMAAFSPPPYNGNGSSAPQQSYNAPPPAKRPRLSPDPRSPGAAGPALQQSSPTGVVNGGYGNPYAQQGHSAPYSPGGYASTPPPGSFNTPQPYQQPQAQWQQNGHPSSTLSRPAPASSPPSSSQMMPPPPRPNKEEREEKVGVDEINDSLFGSGINLKDEENYFHSIWNNRSAQDSFASNKTNSFGSNTISPDRSFNALHQSFNDQSNGAFSGTLSQPFTQEEIENEAKQKREAAARARAEREQHHLKNPFLLGNCVRQKLHKLAYETGVKLDVHGVYERAEPPRPQVMVNGTGTSGVAAVQDPAPSKVDVGVPFEHILSLLSLASGERIRGLVDDAYGLARARRYGDHGRVIPPEFADLATGEGKITKETVTPENINHTSWAKPPDSLEEGGGGQKGEQTAQALSTIAFQGSISSHLRQLVEHDRLAEKERIKRREARKRKAENAGAGDDGAAETSADSPAPADASAPKMSKKEMNKKAKENANNSEAQAINSANTTAAMAFMGKKKNKYNWMTGGMGSVQANRYAKPTPATPSGKQDNLSGSATSGPIGSSAIEAKKVPFWGEWREDGVDGKGIQLRDWIHVLERDGREKKTLLRAGLKLK